MALSQLRRWLAGLGLAACASVATAQDAPSAAPPPLEPFNSEWTGLEYLFPPSSPVHITGWADLGYVGNVDSPTRRFNGPWNSQFRSNEAAVNQLYVIAERKLKSQECGGFDIGGRIDLMYGQDFFLAQSFGFERRGSGSPGWNGRLYGLALPQLYAEVGVNNVAVKLGHFYSPVGYESVMSVNNFFYTHSYGYEYTPFTHWGGLATWKPSQSWELTAGLVNGWDSFDRPTDRVSFIGGAKYTACDLGSLAVGVITGPEQSGFGAARYRTTYNVNLDVFMSEKWETVLVHNLSVQNEGDGGTKPSLWYSVANYNYYKINDKWKIGTRTEWFRDEAGTIVKGDIAGNPNRGPFIGNFYDYSFGANWNPLPNVRVRPEIRWDYFDGAQRPFQDGRKRDQLTLSFDVQLRF